MIFSLAGPKNMAFSNLQGSPQHYRQCFFYGKTTVIHGKINFLGKKSRSKKIHGRYFGREKLDMETYCTVIKDFPWKIVYRENCLTWTVKVPWPWKNNPSWKLLQFELMTNCEEFQPWKLLYREKYQPWKFMTLKSLFTVKSYFIFFFRIK